MHITATELRSLSQNILAAHGFSKEHQHSITETLVTAQIDQCHSHGVWRLLGIIDTLKHGKMDATVSPVVTHEQGAIIKLTNNFRLKILIIKPTHQLSTDSSAFIGHE